MKTIQNSNTGELKRVKNEEAHAAVKNLFWNYVPKSKWKEHSRPSKSESEKKA